MEREESRILNLSHLEIVLHELDSFEELDLTYYELHSLLCLPANPGNISDPEVAPVRIFPL